MLTGKYDRDSCIEFKFVTYPGTHTRGNKLKYTKTMFIIMSENISLQIVICTWNSLPDSVIEANNVNSFKNRIDKYWNNF